MIKFNKSIKSTNLISVNKSKKINKLLKFSTNLIASLVSQLNVANLRKLRFITVNYSEFNYNIIKILYEEGMIRLYIIKKAKILIFFKYFKGCQLFKFKLISRPSKRVY